MDLRQADTREAFGKIFINVKWEIHYREEAHYGRYAIMSMAFIRPACSPVRCCPDAHADANRTCRFCSLRGTNFIVRQKPEEEGNEKL